MRKDSSSGLGRRGGDGLMGRGGDGTEESGWVVAVTDGGREVGGRGVEEGDEGWEGEGTEEGEESEESEEGEDDERGEDVTRSGYDDVVGAFILGELERNALSGGSQERESEYLPPDRSTVKPKRLKPKGFATYFLLCLFPIGGSHSFGSHSCRSHWFVPNRLDPTRVDPTGLFPIVWIPLVWIPRVAGLPAARGSRQRDTAPSRSDACACGQRAVCELLAATSHIRRRQIRSQEVAEEDGGNATDVSGDGRWQCN